MITDDEDDDLRSAFATLRDEDAAHMPSFRDVRDAVRSNEALSLPRRTRARTWALAAAAAVVATIGVVASYAARHAGDHNDSADVAMAGIYQSISTRRSPTRGLLRVPGR
jgi:hypothetical protein